MKGVQIIKMKPASKDVRGEVLKYIPEDVIEELIVILRKKGAVSGEHYHKGIDPVKNPEIVILASGKAEFFARDLKSKKTMKKIISAPAEIRISPFIYHYIKSLDGNTIFLEPHCKKSSYKDVFRLDNWEDKK